MIDGFIVERLWHKLLMPYEDAYEIFEDKGGKKLIGVVADGVTRDPTTILPDLLIEKKSPAFRLECVAPR